MTGPPTDPLSIPSIVPKSNVAAAIVAPEEPILTNPSANPFFTKPAAIKTDAFGLLRYALTGLSPSSTTPSEGIIFNFSVISLGKFLNSCFIFVSSPTKTTFIAFSVTDFIVAGTVAFGP